MSRRRTLSVLGTGSIVLALATPALAAAPAGPAVGGGHLRACAADFRSIEPDGTHGRRVGVPDDTTVPAGLTVPKNMALYAVANDRSLATSGNGALGHQTLAGPTSFACSGAGVSQDDVSWATFRSRSQRSHSITATFLQGQEGFPAICAYLDLAHHVRAAQQSAKLAGPMTLHQCRKWTTDTPLSSTARPVVVTHQRGGPVVVVVRAPKGSEPVGPAVTGKARYLRTPRSTTPTVTVAITSWKSKQSYTFPQALDCSLPAAQRHTCVVSAAVFADQALQDTYGWTPTHAAAAARKIAAAVKGG